MGEQKVELTNWRFKAEDEADWLAANVPGCVHTDLLRNEKISDPFYGTNEKDLQWIDKKDWEYQTVFDVQPDLMNQSVIELVFKGLDTYADVYLNETLILSADNMFRSWRVDVKPLLKGQGNTLRVYFRSPIQVGLDKLEANGYGLPASNDVSEFGGVGDKKLSVFSRKAPYHFGWDWGPRFVTSGIWKDVYLHGWTGSRIEDLFIEQKAVDAALAKLSAKVEIRSEHTFDGTIILASEGIRIEKQVAIQNGINHVEVEFEIQNPKLWWSRGLGEAYQYEFSATLEQGNQDLDSKQVRTGLRSIKLVRDKDEKGTSFYFELNGVPVFAKGANHIPLDSFSTELTYDRYKYEIQSAAEANMNMIRVWGGGIYEYDMFYDLCDEYGILVWQDFMFACSMYPGDEAFLDNVRQEAVENIKRLRNHPSIALWCGNNEIDAAWAHYVQDGGWGWKQSYTPEQRDKIWADYEAVFHNILPEALKAELPEASYWPSSPMSVWSGDASQHALGIGTSGDIHYWGVWHALEPFEDYNVKIGRFMSEYGFQSFPEEKSVRTYAEDNDMELESDVMLAHQKNGRGNSIIKDYMTKYFRTPKDFSAFLYMSQVQQAEGIKSAIEAHRRQMPYCMGTLYWQLNDCWPVASWSSMDYYGRWKALHHYAKKSFKDVMISIDGTTSTVKIYGVSDQLEAFNAQLTVKLMSFDGAVLNTWEQSVEVESNTSKIIWSMEDKEILGEYSPEKSLLYVILKRDGELVDVKEHFFTPAKKMVLESAQITIRELEESNGTRFVLNTNHLAKQVWVSSEKDGVFSDNFFDLIPGVSKEIEFLVPAEGEKGFVSANPGLLKVTSMVDYVELD